MIHFALILLLSFSLVAPAATERVSLQELDLMEMYSRYEPSIVAMETIPLSGQEQEMLAQFYSLLPILRTRAIELDAWFREDHIRYILDLLQEEDAPRLSMVFVEVREALANGSTIEQALQSSSEPDVIAHVRGIDLEIQRLKSLHKVARDFAIQKHTHEFGQTYGDEPYSYHLQAVRAVLKRYGFGPKDSYAGLMLGTAAWLHDVIEDTDATKEDLAELFGNRIAITVDGVSKVENQEGMSSEERVRATYSKTQSNQLSRILKLADRIANVEEGFSDLFNGKPSKVHKYFDEWSIFKEMLYVPGDADQMWIHLERLLTDLEYAQQHALKTAYGHSGANSCSAEIGG